VGISHRILSQVNSFLQSRSVDGYIVGGYVRDSIIGEISRDIDIVILNSDQDIINDITSYLGCKAVELDKERHISRLFFIDEYEDQQIDSYFHIDLSLCLTDIKEDLAARDFTINSMAVSLSHALPKIDLEYVIDPYNGVADIVSKRIECVSDTIFREDPVRLLRAVRLMAQLDFVLTDNTRSLIQRHATRLLEASNERVREEFLKIIQSRNSSEKIKELDELGLLSVLIPELEDCKGVIQPKEHFADVFGHSMSMPTSIGIITRDGSADIFGHNIISQIPWDDQIEYHFHSEFSDGVSRATILKVAGLLHDISKPTTKTFDDAKDKIRFIGHDKEGAEVSRGILKRFRFSNKAIEFVYALINQHLRPTQMSSINMMPTDRAIYRYYRDLGDYAIDTLYLNLADYLSAKGPNKVEESDWSRHCSLIGYILDHKSNRTSTNNQYKSLINGNMIIEEFDIEPGPVIGYVLDLVYEEQMSGNIKDVKSALVLAGEILSKTIPQ